MRTRLPALALVAAAFTAGSLAACGPDPEAAARADEERAALRKDAEAARREMEKAGEALRTLRDETRTLRDELSRLGARVEQLEAASADGPAGGGAEAVGGAPKPAGPDRKAQIEELDALRKKVFDGTATSEEESRFWELARSSGRVAALITELEGKVKEAPADVDARMNLAQAYVAKLLSIPPGPEQGTWSMKAEAQWKKVLELDPEHWEARYSVAFNWSMWPDFLNKTPDAVKEFETLREIQERKAPEAQHGQTYLQLSRLYLKQGKQEKARDALKSGLARHPNDAELKKALDALEN